MHEEDYTNTYKKNHIIKYSIFDKYQFLSFIYGVCSILFVVYLIIKLIDCLAIYKPNYTLGKRFCVYESIFESYAIIYNQIDSYDTTSITKFIFQFFGYKYD